MPRAVVTPGMPASAAMVMAAHKPVREVASGGVVMEVQRARVVATAAGVAAMVYSRGCSRSARTKGAETAMLGLAVVAAVAERAKAAVMVYLLLVEAKEGGHSKDHLCSHFHLHSRTVGMF